jgi:hypothetical protein
MGNFWGAQSEVGGYASTYYPAGGVAAARGGDMLGPLVDPLAATTPDAFCLEGTFTRPDWNAGNPSGTARLAYIGTWAGVNTAQLLSSAASVTEVSGLARTSSFAVSKTLINRAPYRFRLEAPITTSSFWQDAEWSNALSGSGTGALTAYGAITIGGATTGGLESGGFARGVRICNSKCQVCR